MPFSQCLEGTPEAGVGVNTLLLDRPHPITYTMMHIIRDIIMHAIHAGITIGVTELRESPTRILRRAEVENQAVAILNHNKPAGYIISPRMMEAMLDTIAERIAEDRAKKRLPTLSKARKVKLDEL